MPQPTWLFVKNICLFCLLFKANPCCFWCPRGRHHAAYLIPFDLRGCFTSCFDGEALVIMPADECWWCCPACWGRPQASPCVRTVWVARACPNCCWFPGFLPPAPQPLHAPHVLWRGTRGAVRRPLRSSTAPPSTSQTPGSADPHPCPPPSTPDGRQEKNTQSGLVSLGLFSY